MPISHNAETSRPVPLDRRETTRRITAWPGSDRIAITSVAISLIWLLFVRGGWSSSGQPNHESIGFAILFAFVSTSVMCWLCRREFRRLSKVDWKATDESPPESHPHLLTSIAMPDRNGKTIRESHQQLWRLIDDLPGAMYVHNGKEILHCNRSFISMIAASGPEELLGKSPLIVVHPNDHEAIHKQIATGPTTGKNAPEIEILAVRLDGSTFPAELSVTEFRLGRPRHFTGVIRDLTARKRLEAQFQQTQKMEAVGRLAGGVAHDFNNLLTVITGYGHLLFNDLPTEGRQREAVAAILDAGERATNLTRQLLSFSRKTAIEPQVLDLNAVVDKAAGMLRRLIEDDVVFNVELNATKAHIKAAPGQLEQALMNIVVNARDAMPQGGKLQIETRNVALGPFEATAIPPLPPGEYVQLTVTDNGHGMTDEIRGKIFEPFFTTKDVGKGSGLGLSVVQGIVKQCGGSICVESRLNVGTTFRFLIPLTNEVSRTSGIAPAGNTIRGNETVLLVEDSPPVRKITRIALEAQGYCVLEASGGDEAAQISTDYPDSIQLLLTDVVMPEVGGQKLAEALRSERPEIRVLFMTGYTDDAVMQRGVSNAHENLLQKPFTAVGLARKVRAVLDGTK